MQRIGTLFAFSALIIFLTLGTSVASPAQRVIVYLKENPLFDKQLASQQAYKLSKWSAETDVTLTLVLTRDNFNWVIAISPVQQTKMLRNILQQIKLDPDVIAVELDNIFIPQGTSPNN